MAAFTYLRQVYLTNKFDFSNLCTFNWRLVVNAVINNRLMGKHYIINGPRLKFFVFSQVIAVIIGFKFH